jgi:hypothetical protein
MVWYLKHFRSAVFSNGRPQPVKNFNPSLFWDPDAPKEQLNPDGFINEGCEAANRENWFIPSGHELFLISHEDTTPMGGTPLKMLRSECMKPMEPEPLLVRILLLRSAYNNLASRLKMNERRNVPVTACYFPGKSVQDWIDLAKQYQKLLKGEDGGGLVMTETIEKSPIEIPVWGIAVSYDLCVRAGSIGKLSKCISTLGTTATKKTKRSQTSQLKGSSHHLLIVWHSERMLLK